ncbi:LysR substrate-binding domain-containing protein [Kerstersia gyiorum]|jgi:LysR family nitrogen assimilation transcriptional regulator|uniref:LysR family transcriptional regulator n=1 Tax=Kerstersia gyiorum TaxID=206506 RepID=A0A171KVJ7_9BURK|nr:LysR substrate-binding domain-containing protein [Kerstersia gyiorum]AZV94559.1 LysR family transcriptional regulator [Bordetella sp. J329]MCO7638395.1 LysR substrate-binding domain-containing protein [Pseudomonas sp. S 311-6]KAB0542657.1 LysR family transcriptional regulator [Kerstersia gyiorum]KKO72914.1 LysR family transcriptional regulator [Kerstersia gyiorum]MCH4272484.1 LysR substrate-binding domain-containing protein [Kerstersia gyiorum]
MDLKQLEYFVHVAELGSFTRASSVLDVAQPALSRQIRLLEVELRQHLLTRNGRGVTVTEAGRLLLDHARGILHQVARAQEDLGRVRGSLAGRVALGMPPSIARALTVALTREFRQRLPDAALSISEGLSIPMQEWLQGGRLDIALLYNPTSSAEVEIEPLMEETLFLIGHGEPGHDGQPIKLAEVSELPLILPARPNAIRTLVETRMASIGRKPRIALEIDGVPAILDLVADGAGLAILPHYALNSAASPKDYYARPINEPTLTSTLCIATSSRRTGTLTQQAMLDLIRDMVKRVFPENAL